MSTNLQNNKPTTRIIPGLSETYQIVSMPYWAWFWLEDFMQQHRITYQGIYATFGTQDDIGQTLQNLAELHHEYSMREIYSLSNDNDAEEEQFVLRYRGRKETKKPDIKLPKIYKLFGFMSCATTLEAVWERKNYENSTRVT
jgi:hypothetical protein